MNDIIKPFDVDLTKKLHGHVRVETRSRWTGRVVDSQEKDNLVTNAAQLMLQTQAWYQGSGMAATWTPIYEKLLGGIMLFDNTLTEQASNISFPSSAKIVGYAGQEANSANPFAGSYNFNESVKISNGFTTVWDFLTSQANGTIASLSRTNYAIARNPMCSYSASGSYYQYSLMASSNNAITTGYQIIGYDDVNKCVYITLRGGSTIGGVSYTTTKIYKAHQDFSKILLVNMMPPAADLEVVKTLTSSDGTTSASAFIYDKYDNCFLYVNGTTLHVVSAVDGTHTTKTLTGTSGTVLAVTENYYWRASGSVIYRIQKSNISNVGTYQISHTLIAPDENDMLFTWNSSGVYTILYPDGNTIGITSSGTYNPTPDCVQVGPFYNTHNSNNGTYLHPSAHYLGTIANLDSPVTKTSSQTMKITYTLTEA